MNIRDYYQRRYALNYLVICGAGLVFTAGYNMVSAVLRGMGDAKSPFLFILIASVINLALDLLLVPRYGVAGAAWATIIGQAASAGIVLNYMRHFKTVELLKQFLNPH